MAFSYAQKHDAHIRVEFVLNRVPVKIRKYINLVAQILTLAFVIHMSYRHYNFFMESRRIGESGGTLLYLPLAAVKIFFLIGFSLLGILIIRQISRTFRALRQ
jgi:TRAP-type mannitol/chloroaromatic compound transport system permease small subunit